MTLQEFMNTKPAFLNEERWEKLKKDKEEIKKRLQIFKPKKN